MVGGSKHSGSPEGPLTVAARPLLLPRETTQEHVWWSQATSVTRWAHDGLGTVLTIRPQKSQHSEGANRHMDKNEPGGVGTAVSLFFKSVIV